MSKDVWTWRLGKAWKRRTSDGNGVRLERQQVKAEEVKYFQEKEELER